MVQFIKNGQRKNKNGQNFCNYLIINHHFFKKTDNEKIKPDNCFFDGFLM